MKFLGYYYHRKYSFVVGGNMENRAGSFVNNLSGDLAYKSFKPQSLPPNPPIEISSVLIQKLI